VQELLRRDVAVVRFAQDLAGVAQGGQLMTTTDVDNWPAGATPAISTGRRFARAA